IDEKISYPAIYMGSTGARGDGKLHQGASLTISQNSFILKRVEWRDKTMSQRWKEEVRTWLYMVRVVSKIERRLEAHLEQYGLTPPQFEVLAQLQRTPHIVQQQLADRLRMSKGNVVGILNRLEQAGFVIRQAHPKDGRAYLVCLTERGATLVSQVLPEHE